MIEGRNSSIFDREPNLFIVALHFGSFQKNFSEVNLLNFEFLHQTAAIHLHNLNFQKNEKSEVSTLPMHFY